MKYPPTRIACLVVATCALLSACSKSDAPAPVGAPDPILEGTQLRFAPQHPHLAMLRTVKAEPANQMVVDLPAKLVWNEERTQRIYAAMQGRVAAINADLGQVVKPGTLLAQLASPDFGAAQADTAKAQAGLALAQKTLQRQQELFDAGIIARKELEQSQAELAQAQAEHARAAARTRMYGSGTGVNQQLAITASINGQVVERNLNPGQELRPELSGPGMPPLFVVSDPSALWVQIDARENDIASLRVGQSFELVVPTLPGQRFTGVVKATSDFIDPASRTFKVRGSIANPERLLKAEMLANVRVQQQEAKGVVIPASAVLLRGNKQYVFVQPKPGVFEPREVVVLQSSTSNSTIGDGLTAGELVVADNALLLAKQFRNATTDAKITPAASATASAPQSANSGAAR